MLVAPAVARPEGPSTAADFGRKMYERRVLRNFTAVEGEEG